MARPEVREGPQAFLEDLHRTMRDQSQVEFERWGLLPRKGMDPTVDMERGPEFGMVQILLTGLLRQKALVPDGLLLEGAAFQSRVFKLALLLLEEATPPNEAGGPPIQFELLSEGSGSAVVRASYDGSILRSEAPPPHYLDLHLRDSAEGWKLDLAGFPLPEVKEPAGLPYWVDHAVDALRAWYGLDRLTGDPDDWRIGGLETLGLQSSVRSWVPDEEQRKALRAARTRVSGIRVTGWLAEGSGGESQVVWVAAVETHEAPDGPIERPVLYEVHCEMSASEARFFVYYRP